MELLSQVLDFLLHVDTHLSEISKTYQLWTYAILFLIIFSETGLVVTPFLPGDPLLFAAGAIVAAGGTGLNIYVLGAVLFVAAIAGNQVNYIIGTYAGSRIFKPGNQILKVEYYAKTKLFFRKHGGKAVIFSRFFPILRTFVPFVAGVGRMNLRLFNLYNITGAFIWIVSFLTLGYLFGNIAIVKENFALVILAISVLTTTPPIVAAILSRTARRKKLAAKGL